jgi:2-dehydro-3-deoxyphosphooctonate aldolase (KDO 8-P synthase)
MTRIINVGPIPCGGNDLFLIAGPCVIEATALMMKTAETLKGIAERLKIGLIFKSSFQKDNRSRGDNYRGPGVDEGIFLLRCVKEDLNVPILTDVHHPDQCEIVSVVADVLQIPAYLCTQTDLLEAAARTGRVVNIKHGQFLAPENMRNSIDKCIRIGNGRVMVTERGYAFGYNDLVVDPRAFYHLRQTGKPVIFDVTHSVRRYGIPSADPRGGNREFLPVLARAAVASGIDGLFIETHPDPARALCDAASQLPLGELEEFLKPLLELHAVEVSHR